MKKRITALVLLGTLLLTGCGKGSGNEYNAAGTRAVEKVETTTSATSEAAPEEDTPALEDNGTAHGLLAEGLADEGGVIYITEKWFIAQTNEIWLNYEDYLGRTIDYEGYFDFFVDDTTGNIYYYVVRNGPGCCGNDDRAGFEVRWEDTSLNYPKSNTWVRARGVLQLYEETYNGNTLRYLELVLLELEELEERGLDTVAS